MMPPLEAGLPLVRALETLRHRRLMFGLVDAAGQPAGYVSLADVALAVASGHGNRPLESVARSDLLRIRLNPEDKWWDHPALKDLSPALPVVVFVDQAGRLLGAVTAAEAAIRRAQAAEARLREQETQLHMFSLILEFVSDMVTVVDATGTIIWCNGAVERIFGIPDRQFVGTNVFDAERLGIVSKSTTAEVLRTHQRVTSIQTTGGNRRLAVMSSPVFTEAGQIHRVVNISRDITELSSLQEQLRAAEGLVESYRHKLMETVPAQSGAAEVVVRSRRMEQVMELARQVARVNATVLLLGESGVGKGVFTRLIHDMSPRAERPFIQVNCGAIPHALLESELFGYVGGAFTGASRAGKPGLIELADSGTLFLDEIGELPVQLQVKLLQVIQDRKVMRVGASQSTPVDFRLIAATNRDLQASMSGGQFREDLFYRLNVFPIHIPPLRERRDEIPPLVHQLLQRGAARFGTTRQISGEALDRLVAYPWPGNIRQLENVIERLMIAVRGDTIGVSDLPEEIVNGPAPPGARVVVSDLMPLKDAVLEVESQLVQRAYQQYGSVHAAARALGVDASTISRKLRRQTG